MHGFDVHETFYLNSKTHDPRVRGSDPRAMPIRLRMVVKSKKPSTPFRP